MTDTSQQSENRMNTKVTTAPTLPRPAAADLKSITLPALPKGASYNVLGGEDVARVGIVWNRAAGTEEMSRSEFANLLYVKGITAESLNDSEKNPKRNVEALAVLRALIVSTLSDTAQKLLATPRKDLLPEEKGSQDYFDGIVRARFSLLRKALKFQEETGGLGATKETPLFLDAIVAKLLDVKEFAATSKIKVNADRTEVINLLAGVIGQMQKVQKRPVK